MEYLTFTGVQSARNVVSRFQYDTTSADSGTVLFPAGKCVTGAFDLISGRQRDLRTIRRGNGFNVFTTGCIVGKREILAGVVYLQFLVGIAGNLNVYVPVLKFGCYGNIPLK